jgi:integrase
VRDGWRPVPPWVFVTANGTPYSRQVVRTDFRRVLRRCGLGDTNLTVHSLRHSWITWHVERGADPKWLQSQAGHSSIKVTLDLYAKHATLTAPGAADALASALVGNTAGNGALS